MYDIAVIGCGAIGLTTAIQIQKSLGDGVGVTIFADKFTPDTTSDIAAGLWEPYLLGDNHEQDVIRWSKDTFNYALRLWQEGKAKEAGVCLQPIVNLFESEKRSVPKWVGVSLGYNELDERYLRSLSEQYGRKFTSGFMFVGLTWEATIFLPYLQHEFRQRNGTIVEKHIWRFNELEAFDAIVNCTGLEARNLSVDEELGPVRGQVMRVRAPWQNTTYLVQCDDVADSCYVIPNTESVVLGGTKQLTFDRKINQADHARILRNVSRICPSLESGVILEEVVGFRPARNKVRLEEEYLECGNKTLRIVHNYGHGGAGITLCIGCARDAAALVEKLLRARSSKL